MTGRCCAARLGRVPPHSPLPKRQRILGVCDSSEVFAAGLMTLLRDAGIDAASVAEPLAWAAQTLTSGLVLAVHNQRAHHLLRALHAHFPELPVLALVVDDTLETLISVMRDGAAAVLPAETRSVGIISAVRSVLAGHVLMPAKLAQHLLSGEAFSHAEVAADSLWLRELAAGQTISALARSHGCSERTLYRSLKKLYARLEVDNRSQAILVGSQRGLVSPDMFGAKGFVRP